MRSIGFDFGSIYTKAVLLDEGSRPELTLYCRKERGGRAAIDLFLDDIHGRYPGQRFAFGIASNALLTIGRGARLMYPAARSVIEIGGQTSKFLLLGEDGEPVDFATNEACAAGTGSFLEQQAKRLELTIEHLSALSLEAKSGATVAGRCSVFAKSDMIHLQQKGTPVAEIAYGLCLAISRNALTTLLKGREAVAPVLIAGGCARNAGVMRAFRETLSIAPEDVLQSLHPGLEGAMGAAVASAAGTPIELEQIRDLVTGMLVESTSRRQTVPTLGQRAAMERKIEPEDIRKEPVEAFLGIDVGSVSTDLVLLDREGVLLSSIYLPTRGRPVDVLRDGLAMLQSRFPGGLTIAGCGTTGSGRHMAARLIGADVVKNEITCQALGARAYVPDADTILEIGGQDSKFISMRNGAISDFAMNKICAAGTGSFLEEQAREMDVAIVDDFARRAFSATAPLDLGTRCTVFMETEVVGALHEGASAENVCAGLAHSIVRNYLEKVVGSRRIGNSIVFQGGVASNEAVVAAFECALERPVHVHPYNRISGAIGAAIAAMQANKGTSSFRTIAADSQPALRSFECRQCSNRCEVNVVKVGKERAFFGDTCERYTNRSALDQSADLPPNLAEEYTERCQAAFDTGSDSGLRIGIPRASITFETFVFWATFFKTLGHRPVLSPPSSEETLRAGLKHLAVGVCLPIKLAAGHVHTLLQRGVDFVFLPSVIHLPGHDPSHSYPCPYTMAVPFMISSKGNGRLLSPVISLHDVETFLDGFAVHEDLLGATRTEIEDAWLEGWRAQREVDEEFSERALDLLEKHQFRHAFAILGKPYNTFDGWLNLSLFERLRRKGVLAIPQKFLPFAKEDAATAFPWRYSTDMSSSAELLAGRDELRPVIVSNFGCGPDAFALHQIEEETLRNTPHLVLEFDEHRGEAGVITRIEAFLDQIEADCGPAVGQVTSAALSGVSALPAPGSIVRIPYFADHSYAFSGLLRFLGCDAAVLPPPTPAICGLGDRLSGKECHAYSMIAGDLIDLARRSNGDRVTFFFPGASLPCLIHEYGRGLRLLLSDLGIRNITVSTPSSDDLMKAYPIEALERFYLALLSIELLVKAVCQIRPYEREKGRTDAVHARNLARIEASVAGGNVLTALDESLNQLSAIPIHPRGDRPIIGLAGDIYTKTNAVANNGLFLWLEEHGVEVWPSPFQIDLVDFGISRSLSQSVEALDLPSLLLHGSIAVRRAIHQWRIRQVVDGRVTREDEPGYLQMRKLTAPYMPNEWHELLFTNVAKIVDFAQHGADGIINAICFNCMVGNASTAIIENIRHDYNDIPIMSAVYAGGDDPSRRMALEAFVSQVTAHHQRRLLAKPPPSNLPAWFPESWQ